MESVVDCDGGSGLVVTELSHIKELVKQLDVHLGASPDLCKQLASQIFCLTERSIGMIKSPNFDGRKRSVGDAGLDSPLSATPSPLSVLSDMPFRANKKRKTMEKRKEQVRVLGGAETPVDDGHSWRKYGQKEILGTKNPRGYYRCTHRNSQGCAATKQVQRTDEDPTLFDVIYHGTHTCVQKAVAAGQPAAAKAQPPQNPNALSLLQSLSSTLTVKTDGLTAEPQGWSDMSFFSSPVSGLAPENKPFSTPSTPENCFAQGVSMSPSVEFSSATSDSNHLSMDPFHAELRAQSELQEVVSALVAASSNPAPSMEADFSVDGFEFDFDPDFTIDVSSFFA